MSRSIARSVASGNGMCKVMVNVQERWMMEWQVSRCQCALVVKVERTPHIDIGSTLCAGRVLPQEHR